MYVSLHLLITHLCHQSLVHPNAVIFVTLNSQNNFTKLFSHYTDGLILLRNKLIHINRFQVSISYERHVVEDDKVRGTGLCSTELATILCVFISSLWFSVVRNCRTTKCLRHVYSSIPEGGETGSRPEVANIYIKHKLRSGVGTVERIYISLAISLLGKCVPCRSV